MTASPTFQIQQIKDSRISCASGVTSATPEIIDAKLSSTCLNDMNVPPISHWWLYSERILEKFKIGLC